MRRKVPDEWWTSLEFKSVFNKTAGTYMGLVCCAWLCALVQWTVSQTKRWYGCLLNQSLVVMNFKCIVMWRFKMMLCYDQVFWLENNWRSLVCRIHGFRCIRNCLIILVGVAVFFSTPAKMFWCQLLSGSVGFTPSHTGYYWWFSGWGWLAWL